MSGTGIGRFWVCCWRAGLGYWGVQVLGGIWGHWGLRSCVRQNPDAPTPRRAWLGVDYSLLWRPGNIANGRPGAIRCPRLRPPAACRSRCGAAGVVDFDYRPAFRAGRARALGDCSSLGLIYSYFYAETSNAIAADSPYAGRFLARYDQRNAAAGVDGMAGMDPNGPKAAIALAARQARFYTTAPKNLHQRQ